MAYNEIRTINNIQLEDIKARQFIKDLDNKKANKSDIVNGLNFKGTTTYSALPTSNNNIGDFYYVTDGDGANGEGNYAWNGTAWYFSGKTTDFGDISTKANAAVNNTAFEEGKLKVTKNDGTSTEIEVIDSSLTKSNKAADAKITGDKIGQLKEDLAHLVVSYKSENLINPTNCTVGKRMYVNGTVYDQEGDFYTDMIPVSAGDTVWSGYLGTSFNRVQMRHVCAYNSSKNVVPSLGMINPASTYTVPSGVSFIVATFVNTHPEKCSLTIGDALPSEFIEYFEPYIEPVEKAQVDQNKKDITEIKNEISENRNEIDSLKNNQLPISNTSKGTARKYNKGRFHLWEMPKEYDFVTSFNIFTDGNSFKTDFNAESYKNNYSNVKYLSPNGDDSGDGTFEHPWKSFSKVASLNEVTCYLMEGVYTIDNFVGWDGRFYKNFDLIGLGDVRIVHGDCPTDWMIDDGVYKSALNRDYRSCVDIETDVAGIIYTEVNSLSECKATKCSYYKSSDYIYVNTTLENPNSKIALIYNNMSECFLIYAHSFDTTPYLENIKWYGSPNSPTNDSPSVKFVSYTTETGKAKGVFNNCGFYCGYVGVQTNQLAETIFYDCESSNVYTDGFQYFGTSKNIEINCKGYSCGLDHIQDGGQFDNGSTAHGKCTTLRINGAYYGNNGGNCADALDTNAFSICIGCSAFDSKAEVTSQGFALQGGRLSRMYLECCTAFGNTYDIQGGANSTIKVKNCEYDTISENGGTINVIN